MPIRVRPPEPVAVTGRRRTPCRDIRRATCETRVAGSTALRSGVMQIPTSTQASSTIRRAEMGRKLPSRAHGAAPRAGAQAKSPAPASALASARRGDALARWRVRTHDLDRAVRLLDAHLVQLA